MTGSASGGVPAGALPRCRRAGGPFRVLLLHGMGGGVGGWDPVADELCPGAEVWDVALPWSLDGGSTWAHENNAAWWVTEALAAVEHATGAPPDLVVAHSFAANVVLEVAAVAGPEWTCPLVLVAPFFRATPGDFDWSTMGYYVDGFRRMLDDGIRLRAGSRITDEVRAVMSERLCELMGPYTWLRFFDTYLRTPLLPLDEVGVPALVVAGGEDLGALPSGAVALAERLPGARSAVLDGCGHFPMVERPEALTALVDEFAASLHTDREDPDDVSDPFRTDTVLELNR